LEICNSGFWGGYNLIWQMWWVWSGDSEVQIWNC